jgi:hypothetical protein
MVIVYYKDCRIEPVQRGHGSWLANIRRIDRKFIKVLNSPSDHSFQDTMPTVSSDEAIEWAKLAIDGGGML